MENKKRLEESKLFTPYKLGSVTLRNRIIRSAAFESMGKDFAPTKALKDYHVSVARGGVGMTTVAYASINRSGKRSERLKKEHREAMIFMLSRLTKGYKGMTREELKEALNEWTDEDLELCMNKISEKIKGVI